VGRAKSRTRPIPGDHEYLTPGAAGYFAYFHDQLAPFGPAALDPTRGYYSYELGTWHVVALNTECSEVGGCGAGSPQEQWLRADLAAHPTSCTLVTMAEPRFSSGGVHGSQSSMQPLWQALYDGGADLVLSGDDHDYERFAPQTPGGLLDLAAGLTEFVVGTGGRSHYLFATGMLKPNSEVRNDDTYGVLKLTLCSGSYAWEFIPETGRIFADVGSRSCH
jgi:acid phosphatase type 7